MTAKTRRQQQKARKQKQRAKTQQKKKSLHARVKQDLASDQHQKHRHRLGRQSPEAWPGEQPVDVAVFDDSVLATLPAELASEVQAVREAMELATQAKGEAALAKVADIPRRSQTSEWRLLIRGLAPWLADDFETARQAWRRLDFERRPGRIAIALMNALDPNLGKAAEGNATDGQGDPTQATDTVDWASKADEKLLYHAKLIRRSRFERIAIRVAKSGVSMPEEDDDLLVGPQKLKWLQSFAREYRRAEPQLVARLEQTALHRAFAQGYADVLEDACSKLAGPRHDRQNYLLRYFYYSQIDDLRRKFDAEDALENYLNLELADVSDLPEPLRQALASTIHVLEAQANSAPRGTGIMAQVLREDEDMWAVREDYQAAIKAYPANHLAYRLYVDWLQNHLDDEQLNKADREPLLREMADVMQRWSKAFPDAVEPRLWLVDYLLNEQKTEQARPHVEWLAGARHDDPRVRATPWKWAMLDAFRLCRRKTWLDQVPERLDEVAEKWPTWLSRQWLPYLTAGWHLRSQDHEAYEQRRREICQSSGIERDSLPDACMMLAAAQHMRVPANDLKPLRAPIDDAVKDPTRTSLQELVQSGNFFWDLHRTQLVYPAFRMHGRKLLGIFLDLTEESDDGLFAESADQVASWLDDDNFQAAMLAAAQNGLLSDARGLKPPCWLNETEDGLRPKLGLAVLMATLKVRWINHFEYLLEIAHVLRGVSEKEADPYYRFWYAKVANDFEEALEKTNRSPFPFF